MEYKKIYIKEEFIRLDSALKLAGYVSTGGHAKVVIQGGEVLVNGEVCLMRTKKLKKGDRAEFDGLGLEIAYGS
ncbi:MAG: RNA-binding S4 domain-containing protein [Clostridia bacterium]|nr:RNA-binding S4 domain-containing protein [Clostridia bacterium]